MRGINPLQDIVPFWYLLKTVTADKLYSNDVDNTYIPFDAFSVLRSCETYIFKGCYP